MTKPTTLPFGKFIIALGNGANPEVFTAPCGFTDKALNMSASATEDNLPDCDDPDAPAWTSRTISALSAEVTGSGVMAMESVDTWRDWFLSGESKSVRVTFDDADTGGYYAGAAVLTAFNQTAAFKAKAQVSVTMASDGEWTWTGLVSRTGEIKLHLGLTEHSFRLAIKQWERLDEALEVGPPVLLARLCMGAAQAQQVLTLFPLLSGEIGRFRSTEPRQVLYQGLLGAGVKMNEASAIVREAEEDGGLSSLAPLAWQVAFAGFMGVDVEAPAGERMGDQPSPPSQTDGSASDSTDSTH